MVPVFCAVPDLTWGVVEIVIFGEQDKCRGGQAARQTAGKLIP